MALLRNLAGVASAAMAAAALAAPAQAAPVPPDVNPTIIDGHEGSNAAFAARLFTDGQETCTSTIIAPEWILTAQHCVEGSDPASLTFNIGNIDQSKGEKATATEVITHETADLALVKLDHAVETTYARLGTTAAVGDAVEVYGWGATCTGDESSCQSQIIKYANLKVTEVGCSDYRGGTAVCATRVDGIPAGGDSGGPMFNLNSGYQIGVASTSDRKQNTAYTYVTEYLDWIRENSGVPGL